jgi:hypothetical protein
MTTEMMVMMMTGMPIATIRPSIASALQTAQLVELRFASSPLDLLPQNLADDPDGCAVRSPVSRPDLVAAQTYAAPTSR